jgi:hypothetical protein
MSLNPYRWMHKWTRLSLRKAEYEPEETRAERLESQIGA